MIPIPFLAQTTAGGCGACSFIMVARYFNPGLALTEEEALQNFGVDGFGPKCFALTPSFSRAAAPAGLNVRVTSMTRETLRGHLREGPVIIYHKASEALDALPHFSVALAATNTHLTRHDPGLGASIIDTWERFEILWSAAKVSWWPYEGNYTAVLRPRL